MARTAPHSKPSFHGGQDRGQNCYCDAYDFPHRPAGGACPADSPFLCSDCHEPCEAKIVDLGIGRFEYWGSKEVDSQPTTVSTCCGAQVVKNQAFNTEFVELTSID
jgi:hypothetical protein